MFLQATGDPYYLEAGRTILDNLNRFARVPCGFAAMKDVRTGSHEDRLGQKLILCDIVGEVANSNTFYLCTCPQNGLILPC